MTLLDLKNGDSATGTTSGGKNGVDVNISSSDVALGGGTEYTEDAAAATNPVGGAQILVRRDTLSASEVSNDGDNVAAKAASTGAQYVEVTAGTTKLGDSTHGLLVNLGANNDVTVTGTVTANAGTNLNTSSLALETGGNLATAASLLGTIDADTSVIANLAKAEDSVHSSGDLGIMPLAVREDTLVGSLAGAVGDYAPFKSDGNGAVYINDKTSGTQATSVSAIFSGLTAGEAKDFDGAALPNSTTEGKLVNNASSLYGVQYVMPVNEDGSGVAGIAQESSSMTVAGASVTPKFAKIDAASAGDNTLVSAVASKKIRVTSLFLVNGHTSTQTVRFESGASGTALTGQMILGPNGGFTLPYNPNGWFETASNTLLNLELSGATTVDGALTYIEV